jgi:hypothetical protein
MKEGAVLVLRARDLVRFQTSNPDAVTVSVNGGGSQPIGARAGVVIRNQNTTLVLPKERAEIIGEPFPGAAPLPRLSAPAESGASGAPAGTP